MQNCKQVLLATSFNKTPPYSQTVVQ